jgi:hypothetical protein
MWARFGQMCGRPGDGDRRGGYLRDLPQAAIKPAGRRATSGFSFVALLFCRAANDAMN